MSIDAKNCHFDKNIVQLTKKNAILCQLVLQYRPTFNFDFAGFLIDIGMMGEVMEFLSEDKDVGK